ncbi:hypothetical protein A1O3_06205 [Capronia epimyces CBS 606.96]|uniref:Uncharacterized protein n=1 Tax=Capronia epimyces CBS 606.96 TaxID=1182542 RepID=W9XPE8_9EURO|nr:uncharacterized protein A1O3_06205 [Capronia epimyces CBS 606.96]EXJ82392.1 hypothetical protein A1O3_06205 [Capronia epimyces CBS 606.96]
MACADTPQRSAIPDLGDTPSAQLRKVRDQIVKNLESGGELYFDIFRSLQITRDGYQRFFDGVIRVIRNKHMDDLKRGTEASLQHLTDLTLRAFGYIVWTPGSPWLIHDDELPEDEVRLMHVRGAGKENDENARFYPIFEQLWLLMRNVLFERRPPRRPRGQAPRRRRQTQPSTPATQFDREDVGNLADTESSSSVAGPATMTFERNQAEVTRRVETLGERVSSRMPPATNRVMTADETEEGIVDLVVRLSQIRARSDPRIFAALWEQHIMRVEEFDAIEAEREESEPTAATASTTGDFGKDPNASQSHEPWISRGNPIEPVFLDSTLLRPIRPSVMSVYISVHHVASPVLLPENINLVLNPTAAASDVSQQAYHWLDAPVEEHTMHRFFTGINWRIKDHASKILGYVFSYGWNDALRFVSTGRLEFRGLAELDYKVAQEQGTENGGNEDAMDVDDCTANAKGKGKAKARATKESKVSQSVEFHLVQYRFLGMGWQQLQEDLAHAAKNGVRIYRMKVGVIALAQTAEA